VFAKNMDYENRIKRFFESIGYHVEYIPTGKGETPDLYITDDNFSYLVEIKTKYPSTAMEKERTNTLDSGGIYQTNEAITRKNRLSGVISKAASQLNGGRRSTHVFSVVWLLASGYNAEQVMYQFEATLFGSTTIYDVTRNKATSDCFYFYNSDFYRHKEILDGAIISTEHNAKLLINSLSSRYNEFKKSSLPIKLSKAIVDPIGIEKNGNGYIVDGDVDRTNKEAVIKYLCNKYNSERMINVTMKYHSGTMKIKYDLSDT